MKAVSFCSVKPRPTPRLASIGVASLFIMLMSACSSKPEPATRGSEAAANRGAASDGAPIIERYLALDDSRDSTVKLSARITERAGPDTSASRLIQLTMYRKRVAEGRILILVAFNEPAEERDRDGLITVYPDGRLEGIRYVQSTDSFIVTDDPLSEDALFGLTLQELADGQPEKYEFTLVAEESLGGRDVYRLEGKLEPGIQSKFSRLVLMVDKQNFTAREAEFYDNHNELARRLTVGEIEQIGGHWTRKRWTIDNRLRQKTIDFVATDVRYDQGLSDSIFTQEHLKKIASR